MATCLGLANHYQYFNKGTLSSKNRDKNWCPCNAPLNWVICKIYSVNVLNEANWKKYLILCIDFTYTVQYVYCFVHMWFHVLKLGLCKPYGGYVIVSADMISHSICITIGFLHYSSVIPIPWDLQSRIWQTLYSKNELYTPWLILN